MGGKPSSEVILDTVPKWVEHLVQVLPDKEIFVFYNREVRTSLTSRQVFEMAGRFANRLRNQYGFKPGDAIINTLPNSPERIVTDLGLTLAGIIDINGQILLKDGADFFQSATTSRCEGMILSPVETKPAWKLIQPYVMSNHEEDTVLLSCKRAPDMKTGIMVSRYPRGEKLPFLIDLARSKEEVYIEKSIKPDDILVVFTTSGSTGYSKLVPRTHAEAIDMWLKLGDSRTFGQEIGHLDGCYNDRLLGWIVGYPLGTYLFGFKRVLLDAYEAQGMRKGEDMWRAITREDCTTAIIMPLDVDNIVRHVRTLGDNNYKLNTLFCGGQPLKQSQAENMFTIAESLTLVYGSTEGGFLVLESVTKYEDFLCGKPIAGVAIKVVDDKGVDCKTREIGMILAKGKGVFKGFFNRLENPDPNTVKSFTKDGWFCTEDNGYFDENGRLYVVGRHKDLIIYGSVVVYPSWLEMRLLEHPDVVEACVVPVSDPVLYHNICACVKPAPGSNLTEAKLKEYCESIYILDTTTETVPMPKYYLILEDFPETGTGKSDKMRLKSMAEEMFGQKSNSA